MLFSKFSQNVVYLEYVWIGIVFAFCKFLKCCNVKCLKKSLRICFFRYSTAYPWVRFLCLIGTVCLFSDFSVCKIEIFDPFLRPLSVCRVSGLQVRFPLCREGIAGAAAVILCYRWKFSLTVNSTNSRLCKIRSLSSCCKNGKWFLIMYSSIVFLVYQLANDLKYVNCFQNAHF